MPFISYFAKPQAMHVPDGFLSPTISLLTWLIAIALLALAVRRAQKELDERAIPLMGVMAAFIFAAQMLNFPVAGGTSGHLLGGALAAILLGPWAGMLVMASVIVVQGLLFQDGGLLAMGANLLNMGLLTTVIGFGLYRSVSSRPRVLRLTVVGLAAWLSVMAGALAASLELWLSGTSALAVVVPAMLGVHAFIGLGEALVTVAAVAFIEQVRPELLTRQSTLAHGGRGWIVGGVLISFGILLLAPLASVYPDGLQRVARDLGFLDFGAGAPLQILSGYAIPLLGKNPLSTILAGLAGMLAVSAVILFIARILRHPRRQKT